MPSCVCGFGFHGLMQRCSSVWTYDSHNTPAPLPPPITLSMPLLHFLSCIIFHHFQKALHITRTHVPTLFPGTSERATSWFLESFDLSDGTVQGDTRRGGEEKKNRKEAKKKKDRGDDLSAPISPSLFFSPFRPRFSLNLVPRL